MPRPSKHSATWVWKLSQICEELQCRVHCRGQTWAVFFVKKEAMLFCLEPAFRSEFFFPVDAMLIFFMHEQCRTTYAHPA